MSLRTKSYSDGTKKFRHHFFKKWILWSLSFTYLHIHTIFNCMWRGKTGTTASKSSQISHSKEVKLHEQLLITPKVSERPTTIITISREERKALRFGMQSREDTAAKWSLAEGLKLLSSQEAPVRTNAVLFLLHEIFWWRILWNPDIPESKELLIKMAESHRKARGLKYF